jgi:hypothetical protein
MDIDKTSDEQEIDIDKTSDEQDVYRRLQMSEIPRSIQNLDGVIEVTDNRTNFINYF